MSSNLLPTPQKSSTHLKPSNPSSSPFKRSPSNASTINSPSGVGIPEQAFLNARLPAAAAAAQSQAGGRGMGLGRAWTPSLGSRSGRSGEGRGSVDRGKERVLEEEEKDDRRRSGEGNSGSNMKKDAARGTGGMIELGQPFSPLSATSFLNLGTDDQDSPSDGEGTSSANGAAGRFDDPPKVPGINNPFPPSTNTSTPAKSRPSQTHSAPAPVQAGTSTAIYHPFDSPSSPQTSSQPVSPTSPSYHNPNYSLPHKSRRKPPPPNLRSNPTSSQTSHALQETNEDSQRSSPTAHDYIPSDLDRRREGRELSLHKEGELHETQNQQPRSRRSTFGEESFDKSGMSHLSGSRFDSVVDVGGGMNMTSTDRLVGSGTIGGVGLGTDSEVVGQRGRFPTREETLEWNRETRAGESGSQSRSRNGSGDGRGQGQMPDSPRSRSGSEGDPFATFSGRVGEKDKSSRGLRKDQYEVPHNYPPMPKSHSAQPISEKTQHPPRRKSLLDLTNPNNKQKRFSGSNDSRPFMNFDPRNSISNGHHTPHNAEQLSQVYPSASHTTSVLPPDSQPYLRRTGRRKAAALNALPMQSTHYFLRGKLITGGDTIIPFLISVILVLGLTGLWLGTTGVWIWRDGLGGGSAGSVGGKVAVIVFGYLMGVCFGAMMATAFRDPGKSNFPLFILSATKIHVRDIEAKFQLST